MCVWVGGGGGGIFKKAYAKNVQKAVFFFLTLKLKVINSDTTGG